MSKERYNELVSLIEQYNVEYYRDDCPSVPDDIYDEIYQEYLQLEKKNPEWKQKNAPSLRVGGPTLDFIPKGTHTVIPLSLDKSKEPAALQKFFKDTLKKIGNSFPSQFSYTVEPKIDGLTIVCRYEKGLLTRVLTRGQDGIGEVVTEQVKTIRSVPLSIPYQQPIEFHGEAYMKKTVLREINQQREAAFLQAKNETDREWTEAELERLQEKFKPYNERNGASGSIRQLDPSITASRKLGSFFYHIPYAEGIEFDSQEEVMAFLTAQHFTVNPHFYVVHTFEECLEAIEKIEQLRSTLDYAIDGAVVKINDLSLRDSMGFTEKFPKGAIAWKYEAVEKETILKDIVVETGRTGQISYVGLIQPILIEDALVSRVTLNNYNHLLAKGVKLHSAIWIRRSGDVIPELLRCEDTPASVPFKKPVCCPSCQQTLVDIGEHLYCVNHDECPAQQIEKIIHFASRGAMNMEGVSVKTIETLYEKKLIRHPIDLYTLSKESLLALEGFQETKAENVIASIKQSINQPFERVLYALGIRHVGKKTAKTLVHHFSTMERLQGASFEELCSVSGIGEEIANSLLLFFSKPETHEMIEAFLSLGMSFHRTEATVPSDTSFALEGKIFVVTGKFSGYSREDVSSLIEQHGGKVTGSVSKKTSFLVAGEEAGSKLAKAEALIAKGEPLRIVSLEELFDFLPR